MVLAFAEISEVYPTYDRDHIVIDIDKNQSHSDESEQLLPRYEELENVADQDSSQKWGCFSWIFLKFGNIFKKIKSMYSRDEKN